MDINEIRIANMRYLADKFSRRRIAECHPTGRWTENYINQLYGGFGSFGSRTSRTIEKGLKLENGWMDVLHPEVTYDEKKDDTMAKIVYLLNKLPAAEQQFFYDLLVTTIDRKITSKSDSINPRLESN